MAATRTTKTTKAPKAKKASTVKVQYYRSSIGFNVQQKLTVKGLGLYKLNTIRELTDTPSLRGMIAKVPHLVRILE